MKSTRLVSLAVLGIFLLTAGFSTDLKAAAAPPAKSVSFTGDSVRFEHLAVEDGLPNATVLSVLQDQQGFMWFATADGVSRYDGYSFTTFRHDINDKNSLSNNNTFALLETRDGLIWIGTDPGGMNVYDPGTGKFSLYVSEEANPNSLVNDSVWSLCEAQDGSIWIGTRGGLSNLDRKTGSFRNYLVDPKNPRALANPVIYRIYQDRSGVVWIANRAGLQRYDPATDDFTTFSNNPDDPGSISNSNVWAILEDSQGEFWVGTRGGGLNRMDRTTGKFSAFRNDPNNPSSISDDNIWNIYEDHAGNLWISTENGGLNLFNRQTGTFTSFQHNPNDPSTLSSNDLYWMTEDRSGVMWITSRYGGVNKLYPSLWRFGLYRSIAGNPNSLTSNSVYSVLVEDNGIVWIGTFGGGLNRYDRSTGKMTVFKFDINNPDSISNDKISNIIRDEEGVLWVATSGGGLNRMDPVTGKFTAYKYSAETPTALGSRFLTIVKSAGAHRLWVGTLGYGLDLFNTETGVMDKEYFHLADDSNSLTEDTVYDLAVEKSGKVWIATARGGLELLDPLTGAFTHHRNDPNNPNGILSDAVYSIYLDEDQGFVWAGTDSGLSGLDLATQEWHNYTMRDGLPSDTIVGIQPGSSGDLWISTGKGISRFAPATKTFTNYDARDGLQGDQFAIASSYRAPDGELFFGGSSGVTFFHPDQIAINPYLVPVVFTDFQLFNQSVSVGSEILPRPIEKMDQIVLAYDQSVFTIKFAALNYQFSSKSLYQYKMEGFDKDWSPARSKREVTYTSLPPGSYSFTVRAANNDGVWNSNAARIVVIKILPPWWETLWFRGLSILAVIAVIFGGVQFRIRRIHATNRQLEMRVNERTRELEEAQMNLHSANDELKTQLNEITILEKEVRELAIHDALTGLYNRHYLSERLAAEYSRAERENHPVAFLLMDIDNFKLVNDAYGHQAGDHVLKVAAQVVAEQTRRSDIACRYGGEEFMVILPKIDLENALQRAEYFRKRIDELPIEFGGQQIHISISIGVAIYPLHGCDNDKILSSVDAALYQAKNAGRNMVVLYDPESGILPQRGEAG